MSLTFFADHQTASVIVGLVGLIASIGYIATRPKAAPATARPATPLPTAKPRPASLELGQAEHQKAGHAPTVKLAQVKPTAKDIATEVVREPREHDTKAKVQRMEDLGFHTGAERTATETITTNLNTPAAAPTPMPADRSQTAELDDILSRIDKVLAENPVLATNTMTGATDTQAETRRETEGGTAPGDQQKLF